MCCVSSCGLYALHAAEPVRLHPAERQIDVVLGQTFSHSLTVSGMPSPSVMWSHLDHVGGRGSRLPPGVLWNGTTLSAASVTFEMSGEYQAHAVNSYSSAQAELKLTVKSEAMFVCISSVVPFLRSRVAILCTADGGGVKRFKLYFL